MSDPEQTRLHCNARAKDEERFNRRDPRSSYFDEVQIVVQIPIEKHQIIETGIVDILSSQQMA